MAKNKIDPKITEVPTSYIQKRLGGECYTDSEKQESLNELDDLAKRSFGLMLRVGILDAEEIGDIDTVKLWTKDQSRCWGESLTNLGLSCFVVEHQVKSNVRPDAFIATASSLLGVIKQQLDIREKAIKSRKKARDTRSRRQKAKDGRRAKAFYRIYQNNGQQYIKACREAAKECDDSDSKTIKRAVGTKRKVEQEVERQMHQTR